MAGICQVSSSTTLEGRLQYPNSPKPGIERATRREGAFNAGSAVDTGARADFSGTYDLVTTDLSGTKENSTVVLTPNGDGYTMTQTFSTGTTAAPGIGVVMGQYIAIAQSSYYLTGGFGGEKATVRLLERVNGGKTLRGSYQVYGTKQAGTEVATRRSRRASRSFWRVSSGACPLKHLLSALDIFNMRAYDYSEP